MSDDTTTEPTTEVDPAEGTDESTEPKDEVVEGEDALGDKGKQALDRMKQERNAEKAGRREDRKKFDADLAALRAEIETLKNGGKEDETAKVVREAEAAALAKANERILKAEAKAAAVGKLADPQDVHRFIDLSEFEVDSDGNVDAEALAEAIDDLLKNKPYLAAQGRRFQGTGDGGARPSQPKKAASLEEAIQARFNKKP